MVAAVVSTPLLTVHSLSQLSSLSNTQYALVQGTLAYVANVNQYWTLDTAPNAVVDAYHVPAFNGGSWAFAFTGSATLNIGASPQAAAARGFKEMNGDPIDASATTAFKSQYLMVYQIVAQAGGLISNINLYVTTVGSTLTAATTTSISGAAANAQGAIRLTVSSTAGITSGNVITVSAVTGTTEANGAWPVTVVDGTHLDLGGSAFVNAYISGGTATLSFNVAAIYGASGQFLSATVDAVALFETSGLISLSLATPITIGVGEVYYVAVLTKGTTPPIVASFPTSQSISNVGMTGAGIVFGQATGTGYTGVPAPAPTGPGLSAFNPNLITATGMTGPTAWVALS